MFGKENFEALADGLEGFEYEQMLAVCDAIVSCIDMLNGLPDDQRRAQVAGAIVDTVMATPFFNLDELYRQVYESPMTATIRVVRRLNGALLGYTDRLKGGDTITDETRELYAVWRAEWLAGKRPLAKTY
jgi:hypothetical protein